MKFDVKPKLKTETEPWNHGFNCLAVHLAIPSFKIFKPIGFDTQTEPLLIVSNYIVSDDVSTTYI